LRNTATSAAIPSAAPDPHPARTAENGSKAAWSFSFSLRQLFRVGSAEIEVEARNSLFDKKRKIL